MIRPITER